MTQYKCVPAPKNIVIGSDGNMDNAVKSFSDLMNSEVAGGWIFYSMEEISVIQEAGCIASIFGGKATQITYNMLIFKKD